MPGNRRNAPRLCDFDYSGSYAYFITSLTYQRHNYFDNSNIVNTVLPVLRHSSEKYGFDIYIYCFMPDHVHLLAVGTGNFSLVSFMKTFKQKSGFVFRKISGNTLWHRSYYERVLRKDEVLKDVALYILNNPVRAGLVDEYKGYPFSGSFVFNVNELDRIAD